MARTDRLLDLAARHGRVVAALAFGLILIIGVGDLETGPEHRVFPLYFIPISIGSWAAGRKGALLFTLAASVVWGASNWAWHAGEAHFASNVFTQAVAFGSIGAMTAAMRRNYDSAIRQATVDALTGLANIRGFEDRARDALALADRQQAPVTLVYLDLDDFKEVNDTQGHAEGDRVLQTVADVIRSSIRKSDLSARLGGDEFALLLVDSDREASRRALDRLQTEVSDAMESRGWPVRISIGALVLPRGPGSRSLLELMRTVDGLMYEAKARGKDTLILREEGERGTEESSADQSASRPSQTTGE